MASCFVLSVLDKAKEQGIGALNDDWVWGGVTIAQKVVAAHCSADVVSRTVGEEGKGI